MIDFTQASPAEFLKALQRGTNGMWSVEAAVWLLEQHAVWIQDPRLRKYIESGVEADGETWAGLNIQKIDTAIDAGDFGEWGEDIAVLCFALSLYGDYPISLRYTCENLAEETLALMGKSLFLASGYSEPASTAP